MSQTALSVICIVAACLSVISIGLASIAISFVVGLKNSTHNIQYIPVDTEGNSQTEEELSAGLNKIEDDFNEDHI